MKVYALLLLLTPLAWAADPPVPSVPFSGPLATTPAPVPDISLLRLETSRCLRACPAFTVSIRRDGSFSYSGEEGVEHLGEQRGRLEQGEYEQVLRYISEIGFAKMKDRYASPYLDNGSSMITIVQDGKRKTVTVDAGSGPATLWALEKLVTGMLERATWETRAP